MNKSKRIGKQPKQNLWVIGGVIVFLLLICGTITVRTGMWLAGQFGGGDSENATTPAEAQPHLGRTER